MPVDASSTPEQAPSARPAPSGAVTVETVLSVRHYTDALFAFRITRPPTFRFRAGEFVMVGLDGEPRPILRAYSMCSPTWDEGLDFFSIKAPGGALTTRLQHIEKGDPVLLGKKPTGTLVHDALSPGRRLFLFATGTGVAPFISLIREPETYERFDEIVLTHTCRGAAELRYGHERVAATREDPLVGDSARAKLTHFATTTREPSGNMGRVTSLIESGALYERLGRPPLDPASDRAMICGSEGVLKELKGILQTRGFTEGSNAAPGDFTIEKAFVG